VSVWVCGCVGVWVCGCVGVWVRGCVGACGVTRTDIAGRMLPIVARHRVSDFPVDATSPSRREANGGERDAVTA